jgi:sulfhydrogenase subunit alpha
VAGTGNGANKARRGQLCHRYGIDADATIEYAKIVPPTAPNQQSIEDDAVGRNTQRDGDALRSLCEQTIRNYDPCISCARHFLTLDLQRR